MSGVVLSAGVELAGVELAVSAAAAAAAATCSGEGVAASADLLLLLTLLLMGTEGVSLINVGDEEPSASSLFQSEPPLVLPVGVAVRGPADELPAEPPEGRVVGD